MEAIELDDVNFETYFNKQFIDKKSKYVDTLDIVGLKITPVKTIHSRKLESYGIYIEDQKVFITGDTKYTPEHLKKYYKEAKYIFQDCEFKDYEGGPHAQYRHLKTLPQDIKGKMFLYHYELEDMKFEELEARVKKEGFAGLVKRGFKLEL